MSPIASAVVLAAGTPLDGITKKAIAIIVAVAAVAIAFAALKVLGRSHNGDVRKDMNVAGSAGVGVFLLVVALCLGGLVAWMTGVFGYFGWAS